jgi:hypothetical protein
MASKRLTLAETWLLLRPIRHRIRGQRPARQLPGSQELLHRRSALRCGLAGATSRPFGSPVMMEAGFGERAHQPFPHLGGFFRRRIPSNALHQSNWTNGRAALIQSREERPGLWRAADHGRRLLGHAAEKGYGIVEGIGCEALLLLQSVSPPGKVRR